MVIYATKEGGRGILASVLFEEAAAARMVVEELLNVMNEPRDQD